MDNAAGDALTKSFKKLPPTLQAVFVEVMDAVSEVETEKEKLSDDNHKLRHALEQCVIAMQIARATDFSKALGAKIQKDFALLKRPVSPAGTDSDDSGDAGDAGARKKPKV